MRHTLALAVLILLAVAAPTADAYNLGGKRWPGRTITYHSVAKKWDFAIRDAVEAWNTSGVKVRFKPASRSRARLHIGYEGPVRGIAGRATLGYAPPSNLTKTIYPKVAGGRIAVDMPPHVPCGGRVRCERGPRMWLERPTAAHLAGDYTRHQMRMTVAHELGHSLGLQHVKRTRCALMAFDGEGSCPDPEAWQRRCRILTRDDVRGAVKRYGGTVEPTAPEICDVYGPPLAVTGLAASYDDAQSSIVASWTTTEFPKRREPVAAAALDTCPTDPSAAFSSEGTTITLPAYEYGRYCVAVWAADEFGRYSDPVTVFVDAAPPPEPPPEEGF